MSNEDTDNSPFSPKLTPEEAQDAELLQRWAREGKARGYVVIVLHPDGTMEVHRPEPPDDTDDTHEAE